MKNASLLAIALALSALTGCKAQASDPNIDAFKAVAPSVTTVKEVTIPGSADLDGALAKLGGFPASADIAVSKKAVDTQYAVGRDKDGKAVIAVSLAKDGTVTVVTDPDLITGYTAKVRSLTGEKSTASTGSSASSGPGGASSSDTPKKKMGPFYVGMSKSEAASAAGKYGTAISKDHEGSDHETWLVRPLQSGAVAREGIGMAMGAVGGGIFGSAVGQTQKGVKEKSYYITFNGDVIGSIDVSSN